MRSAGLIYFKLVSRLNVFDVMRRALGSGERHRPC
jgi:hypothetical protein